MTDKVFLLTILACSLNARLFSLFSELLKTRSTHSRPRGACGLVRKKNYPFSRLLRLPNTRVQFLKDAGLNPDRLLLFFPSAREIFEDVIFIKRWQTGYIRNAWAWFNQKHWLTVCQRLRTVFKLRTDNSSIQMSILISLLKNASFMKKW
jgi:hypothetical protein